MKRVVRDDGYLDMLERTSLQQKNFARLWDDQNQESEERKNMDEKSRIGEVGLVDHHADRKPSFISELFHFHRNVCSRDPLEKYARCAVVPDGGAEVVAA